METPATELVDCDELLDNTKAPSTKSLVYVVDVGVEKHPAHSIMRDEVPSPINPPQEYVFYPRSSVSAKQCRSSSARA